MSVAPNSAYAGDVSVLNAYQDLATNPTAVLVDVRTEAEWNYVGVPNLADLGKEPLLIEWQSFPTMALNKGFVEALNDALGAHGANKDAPIYFLCRSGARSRAAAIAATAAGWRNCFNIREGFEGPRDDKGRRGTASGWKAAGLPWSQS